MPRYKLRPLLIISVIIGFMSGPVMGQDKEADAFRWLPSGGETSGVVFETHRLQPLSLEGSDDPSVEIEQEEVQVDA